MSLGLVAGLISLAAFLPYLVSILSGRTQPSRVTWCIWSWLGILLFLSYRESGATDTLWVPFTYVITPLAVAILSLRYGAGGWTKLDIICLLSSLVSTGLWLLSGSAVAGLILFLLIDLCGLLPTIRKSYLFPEQESRTAWGLMVIANLVNLIAIERLSFSILIYPLYLLCSGSVILALSLRRPRVPNSV